MLGSVGVTEIETRAGVDIVRPAEPEIEPTVALIVAVPAATPVANPAVLTVANAGLEEVQFAEVVRFCWLPLL